MKKHILLIMAVATALNIAAQDDKYHFTIETSAGLARYYNYSPLSLVEDAKGTYTAPTLSLSLGVRKNSNEFGLRYRLTNVRTSALALGESVDIHDISLLYRRSAMVSPRLELFGGVATGLSIINNHMAKVALEGTRHGLNIGFETGLRYYLGDYTYLSLTAGSTPRTRLSAITVYPTVTTRKRAGSLSVDAVWAASASEYLRR